MSTVSKLPFYRPDLLFSSMAFYFNANLCYLSITIDFQLFCYCSLVVQSLSSSFSNQNASFCITSSCYRLPIRLLYYPSHSSCASSSSLLSFTFCSFQLLSSTVSELILIIHNTPSTSSSLRAAYSFTTLPFIDTILHISTPSAIYTHKSYCSKSVKDQIV